MSNYKDYKYIEIKENVCGGRPVIKGTRLEPEFIVSYGKVEEIMEDFDLSLEQIEECFWFVFQHSEQSNT